MHFLKNIFNHYIVEGNALLYLLATIGSTILLYLLSSFWQPKLKQIFESKLFLRQDWFYFLLIASVSLLLFAAHASIFGFPIPADGDEYCYLLMAKTFAAGRITNPPHELAQFFDNFHVLNEPTYTGKYPPAQAFFLAIGILLFNNPIVGVWISGALGAVACFWMLQAFFPIKWSLFGALLALTHPTIFNWNYGYFYGNAGFIGGALCLGATFRFVKIIKTKDVVIFAAGLAILANSRPYEGLLVCLPLAAIIIWWILKRFNEPLFFRQLIYNFVVPVGFVLLLNFVWMGYYNWRTTEDVLKLPYSLYTAQYDPVPLFLPVLSPPVPDQAFRDQTIEQYSKNQNTRNLIMKEFYINEIDVYYINVLKDFSFRSRNIAPFFLLKRTVKNLIEFLSVTLVVYAGILLLGIYVCRSNKKYLFFTAAFFFCLFFEGLATYNQNHYYAPFVGFLIVAMTGALATAEQKVKSDAQRKFIASFALSLIIAQTLWLFFNTSITHKSRQALKWKTQVFFEESFDKMPDQHLVLIDYTTGNHQASDGRWILITARAFYNEPDIDQSKVVWANSLDKENNQQLFDYFDGRHVWMLGFEKDDSLAQPKFLSCENLYSEYQPSAELENVLRDSCPK